MTIDVKHHFRVCTRKKDMLNLRKGCKVPFPKKLFEGYTYTAPCFTANVNADKMEKLLENFIELHREPLFFILELPTNQADETELCPGEVASFHNSVINTLPKIPCMFKEYSFKTMLNYVKANVYCLSQPIGQEKVDFLREAVKLDVPVYLFMGRYDYNTVHDLAKEWFDALQAPQKKFFTFEKSGHTPQWEEAADWNNLFAKEVLGTSIV